MLVVYLIRSVSAEGPWIVFLARDLSVSLLTLSESIKGPWVWFF